MCGCDSNHVVFCKSFRIYRHGLCDDFVFGIAEALLLTLAVNDDVCDNLCILMTLVFCVFAFTIYIYLCLV